MANEFIIKNGIISEGDSQITGSLNTSGHISVLVLSGSTISGSFVGDGSSLSGITSGETNTASNTGSGDGLFVEKVSSDLRFKTILGTSGISITTSSNEITINKESIVFDETKLYFSSDISKTTILIGTNSGSNYSVTYPVNTLSAVAVSGSTSNIRVQLQGGAFVVANSMPSSSIYIDDTSVTTSSQATAVNELNALFVNAIGQTAPAITSNTSISLTEGNTVNYTLRGTDIVAYSWDSLPTGVAPVDADPRTIIGGSALTASSYVFTGRATNYFGEVTASLTLTVDPDFTNTYSFYGGDSATDKHFLVTGSRTAQTDSPLFRPGQAHTSTSYAPFAWSVSWWHKSVATHAAWWGAGYGSSFGIGGTAQNRNWCGFDVNVWGNSSETEVQLRYGSKFNWIAPRHKLTGTSHTDWKHIVMTYSGGDTEGDTHPDGITGVYDCFKVYINSASVARTTDSNAGNGFTGTISGNGFSAYHSPYDLRILRAVYAAATYHSGKVSMDEIAFYDYVLTPAQINTLYNDAVPISLIDVAGIPNPKDYFRMGDGEDSGSSNTDRSPFGVLYNQMPNRFNMIPTNMDISDYVSDVPTGSGG